MHLHDLKSHPVIKAFAYAGFFLIIISFVFFYGWGTKQQNDAEMDAAFARYHSSAPLSFLPWRRWETIHREEVVATKQEVINRKIAFLPPQFQSFVLQNSSMNLERFATLDEMVKLAVDRRMLLDEAKRLDIDVTREEVIAMLRAQPGMNQQILEATAKQVGLTIDGYLSAIRRDAIINRVRAHIMNDAQVSLYELWLEYLLVNEKMKLRLASFPVEHYHDLVEITDADLNEYLTAHHEEFRVPAKRRYAYAKIAREDFEVGIEPTESQLKAHYAANVARFSREAGVKIDDAMAPVSDDQPTTVALQMLMNFAPEATLGTDWTETIDRMRAENKLGGTLYYNDPRWVERNAESNTLYGRPFIDLAFALADDTVSTTPIASPRGLHLIRRMEERAAGAAPFEEVRTGVLEDYKKDKSTELFQARAKELKDAVGRYTTLRDFATDMKLEDGLTTEVLAGASFIPEIGSLAQHRTYVAKLKPNQLSAMIRTPEVACALQVVEERETYLPPLDEVREEVEAAVRSERAVTRAKAEADAAYAQLSTGEAFARAAEKAPGETIETDLFTRLERVEKLGFPLIGFGSQSARIAKGSVGLTPYGVDAKEPEGYVLWEVIELQPPSREGFATDRRQFEQEFLTIKRMTLVEEWLADARERSGYKMMIETEDDDGKAAKEKTTKDVADGRAAS